MINGKCDYCVYVHTFPNGKRYVGQCKQPAEQRWQGGSGYKRQPLIHNAIVKYGWDNIKHEVVRENLTAENAWVQETLLIKEYNTNALNGGNGYNMSDGGESGSKGYKHTDEHKAKMSEINAGSNNGYYGKTHTEEIRQKISAANKGKRMSQESRDKMRVSRSGEKHFLYGKPRTDEVKQKISAACSGERGSQYGKRGALSTHAKTYLCVETGIIYKGLSAIAEELHIPSASNISNVCNGKRKSAYGFRWQYANINQENGGTND